MFSFQSFRCSLLFLAACCVATVRAAEPAIIAKARAFLGTDAALDAVNSLHFTGTLVVTSGETNAQTPTAMELIFQKPYQQRVQATSAKMIEVTALDGYDGWRRLNDPADSSKWQQSLLGADPIKRLRANTWENLGFFRGIESVGGRVEDQGPVTFEGTACQKIAFIHAPTIIFYRYFEIATGRLVYTETENGSSIRESGELRVNGIRFPKSMTNTTKLADGNTRTYTITFDKITVNETFPPSTFAIPALSAK